MVFLQKIDPDYNPVEIEETIINAESMQSIFDRLELENQEGNHPNGDEDSIEIEMNVSVEDEAAAFKEERAHASEVVIPSESDAILRGYVAETSASVEIPTSTIDVSGSIGILVLVLDVKLLDNIFVVNMVSVCI